MKVLNLYAGIGGNRKLWEDVEVTAVEMNPQIAAIYKDFFPNDNVIVADAHEYLLNHFKEYDFIWSSPPCPTHSRTNTFLHSRGIIRYPDMTLYQEIILLKHFAPLATMWVVENVKPYYKPLIQAREAGRHLFWSNFDIKISGFKKRTVAHDRMTAKSTLYGFNIEKYNIKGNNKARQILRNLVNPEIGLMILDSARNIIRKQNTEQTELFSESICH